MVTVVPPAWDRAGLEQVGFVGFRPFSELPAAGVPRTPGVYVVLRPGIGEPSFLDRSPARWRGGNDPSYLLSDLSSQWVPGSTVVYIGKAKPEQGLHRRLSQFRRMAANHSGGRSIRQLADSAELLVAWLETPGEDPALVETEYLLAFEAQHERLPFANRRH